MSKPTITHTREIVAPRNVHSIRVKIERTATLDSDLKNVTRRSDGRIHLITRHGYHDAHSFVLFADDARSLADALNAAAEDVETARAENDALEENHRD